MPEAGDTVVVEFPFEEGTGSKRRIALVVRVEGCEVKVCYGTSHIKDELGGRFVVDEPEAMRLASLRMPTMFDLEKAYWAKASNIRVIGHIPVHANPWRQRIEAAFRRAGLIR